VKNYLAWPVHTSMASAQIAARKSALEGLAELVLLTIDGKQMELGSNGDRDQPPESKEWEEGLTSMRIAMAASIDARIVLGGRTEYFKGRLPGIAEEALIRMKAKAPLFLMGGFGGCSFGIARAMGLSRTELPSKEWDGINAFRHLRPEDLRNGLSQSENERLAETIDVDEAIALILRGLSKLRLRKKRQSKRT
jgi:hypothetical protein